MKELYLSLSQELGDSRGSASPQPLGISRGHAECQGNFCGDRRQWKGLKQHNVDLPDQTQDLILLDIWVFFSARVNTA